MTVTLILFFVTFFNLELSHFNSSSTKAYRHCISCERNSSYNFTHMVLKRYMSFCEDLKMCMRFGCIHLIFFVICLQFVLSHSFLFFVFLFVCLFFLFFFLGGGGVGWRGAQLQSTKTCRH